MQTLTPKSPQKRGLQPAKKRSESFALSLAPMIDLIFLLLIFFLVSSKWKPQENFLPLQMPAASAHEQSIGRPEPLLLHISAIKDGCQVQIGQLNSIQIKNQSIEEDLAGLLKEIRDCMLRQKRFVSDPVEVVCQPQVKWNYLAKIYNVLYGAGLSDITFLMTEPACDVPPN